MNVAALAVGVGALCLTSIGGPQAAETPSFSGPVFVTAPGFVNRVAANEVLRTIDLPFTMDAERVGSADGRAWPKVGSYKTLVIVPGFPVDGEDWGSPHPDELNRIRALIAQRRKRSRQRGQGR